MLTDKSARNWNKNPHNLNSQLFYIHAAPTQNPTLFHCFINRFGKQHQRLSLIFFSCNLVNHFWEKLLPVFWVRYPGLKQSSPTAFPVTIAPCYGSRPRSLGVLSHQDSWESGVEYLLVLISITSVSPQARHTGPSAPVPQVENGANEVQVFKLMLTKQNSRISLSSHRTIEPVVDTCTDTGPRRCTGCWGCSKDKSHPCNTRTFSLCCHSTYSPQ